MAVTYQDLFNIILAMDSYNRGYLPGLKLEGSRIGDAAILQSQGFTVPANSQAAGFFAQAYRLDSGEVTISYRGTDINFSVPVLNPTGTDLLNAYGVGAGSPFGPQAQLAVQFYNQVLSASPAGTQIALTGHSSGGGLAGYVATLYGKQGWLFDNMAFESAAASAQYWANQSYQGLGNPDDSLTIQGSMLLAAIYGNQQPWENDRSRLQAWNTAGEFLAFNRGGQQTPSTALAIGPDVDLPGVDSGILGSEGRGRCAH
jgi:hypothetical protein